MMMLLIWMAVKLCTAAYLRFVPDSVLSHPEAG